MQHTLRALCSVRAMSAHQWNMYEWCLKKEIYKSFRKKIISLNNSYLFSECIAGFYGENCNNNCGHCLKKTACHHINGMCDEECEPGYKVPYCTEGDSYKNIFNKYNSILLEN